MSLNFMKVRYFNTQLNSPSVIYNGGCKLNVLLFQRGSNLSAFKCFFPELYERFCIPSQKNDSVFTV